MSATNYTPIDHLLPKPTNVFIAPPRTKESEPFGASKEVIRYHEPIEQQELDEDVKQYVDVRKVKPEIPPELKKIGLKEANPDLFKDVGNVKLPLSDDKIAQGLQAPLTSSLRWLATFALYLLQQSHMTLKTVHGKVIRMVKK